MSSAKALSLKEEGNRHFQEGDYAGADALYSKAIIADPTNPTLYTNRSMARLKLDMWDSVTSDCKACLEIAPNNMKGHYYLAQAELALKAFDDAVAHAKCAHEICIESNDKSLTAVTALVLRCKKERWEDRERRRLREDAQLEAQVLSLMETERDRDLKNADNDGDRKEIAEEWEEKLSHLSDTFERARVESEKRREVPDWVIDDITFGIMVDPVITKTGKSYERSAILEHLRRSSTDPLTRETLTPADLRPNINLKQACEEFLDKNGWAVDW
ncbi:u-box domain protein [Grosmannia clavigera kw1407]|uniref:E3 ubiquitin-protein ligase CHIP n=1 Tax=Grosmannia clavigera (strain kw1407 / UAMH 11150) TaxID=655863 RepID=F0X8P8_GROCL|nr:u-box domain protein [Grosmannia clavigera kw1407]EFX06056.1 u-box domain protein [Grosmannia clavigera kw1407]